MNDQRKTELEFIERHREADLIYDTKMGRVVYTVYPPWHPWGRLQRFFWELDAKWESSEVA